MAHGNIQRLGYRLSCSLAVIAASLFAGSIQGWESDDYVLEVIKSERALVVRKGDRIEKSFVIATGRGGRGDKIHYGDKKTPVGTYRIVAFNDNSRFHYFMQLNYPNVKDAFYGLKNAVITEDEFDRIITALKLHRLPPQNTRLGGAIGIHGIGDVNDEKMTIHGALDWTEGCIALTNEQINELKQYVHVGTMVVINE